MLRLSIFGLFGSDMIEEDGQAVKVARGLEEEKSAMVSASVHRKIYKSLLYLHPR